MVVDGAKQLTEVDIGGGTITPIAELAVVSDKNLWARVAF